MPSDGRSAGAAAWCCDGDGARQGSPAERFEHRYGEIGDQRTASDRSLETDVGGRAEPVGGRRLDRGFVSSVDITVAPPSRSALETDLAIELRPPNCPITTRSVRSDA